MYDRVKAEKKKSKSIKVTLGGKTWDKESVKDLLRTNDKAVQRAILRIYTFQTDEEKYFENVKVVNGKGFNKFDAEVLSNFARQIKRGQDLTEKQMYVARPKIMKYAGQLLSYMKTKEK